MENMFNELKDYSSAFIEARKKMQGIENTGYNSFTKKKYRTLADVIKATVPFLLEQGIYVRNSIDFINERELLITRLVHAPSGQYDESKMVLIYEKVGNQERGAAITYAMKSALQALCGIADFDDDFVEEQPYYQQEKTVLPDQAKQLEELLLASKNPAAILRNILEFNKIKALAELPQGKFSSVKTYIQNYKG